jgi:competence protein ComEC
MVLHILCFVAGIGVLQTQPILPEPASRAWLIAPLLVLLLRSQHRAAQLLRKVAGCLLAGGVGFFWAALVANDRLADELPSLWEGQDIRVVGVIAKLPQPFHRGIRFQFDVESVLTSEAQVPKRISLAWYGSWQPASGSIATPDLRVGERWQMTVRLRRPHGTANPHGFDYEAWLLERGVRATGYVRLDIPPQRIKTFVPRPGYAVESVREAVRARILTALEG